MYTRSERLQALLVSDVSLTPRSGRQQLQDLINQRNAPNKIGRGLYIEGKMAILECDFDQAVHLFQECKRLSPGDSKKADKYLSSCHVNRELVREGYIVSQKINDMAKLFAIIFGVSAESHFVNQYASNLVEKGFTCDIMMGMNPYELEDMASKIEMQSGHVLALKTYIRGQKNFPARCMDHMIACTLNCLAVHKRYKVDVSNVTDTMVSTKAAIMLSEQPGGADETEETHEDETGADYDIV
jgi:hypothetical protein